MKQPYKYYANWQDKATMTDKYNYWTCQYEISIIEYLNDPETFIVEYMDQWTLGSQLLIPGANQQAVKVYCRSLEVAKLFGDKIARECEAWIRDDKTVDLTKSL